MWVYGLYINKNIYEYMFVLWEYINIFLFLKFNGNYILIKYIRVYELYINKNISHYFFYGNMLVYIY